VFRARDTRLNRDVAVKVSSEQFSERFEREARVMASLNHPNICTLHDVGPNCLVMELIDPGRTDLGGRRFARRVVGHRQTDRRRSRERDRYRDLKPGNVKIKLDGVVKVLDFGLAKTGGTPTVSSDLTNAHNSPDRSGRDPWHGLLHVA